MLGARLELRAFAIGEAEFPEALARLDLGLREVAGLGLGEPRAFGAAPTVTCTAR